MRGDHKPDVSWDLIMDPQCYWETYDALKRDSAIGNASDPTGAHRRGDRLRA